MTSLHDRTARLREAVVPGWLGEALPDWLIGAVRPKPAPVPWGAMVRAALAVCVPLSVGFVVGRRDIGLRRRMTHLMAVLNASSRVSEAVITLRREGTRPPPPVAGTLDRLADAIAAEGDGRRGDQRRSDGRDEDAGTGGGRDADGPRTAGQQSPEPPPGMPPIPPPWSSSPGSLELRDGLAALARTIAWTPATPEPASRTPLRERARAVLGTLLDQLRGGRLAWTFTIRLMVCIGVAAVASEVLPLQRSYWVVLTVAVVVKPDNGSVFARALQRGIGTIVGVVLGAVILVAVPYGPWLLFPMAVLAAGQPYGRLRNYGLAATFMTPLVVLLIDLLAPSSWRLPEQRLVDTLLGCAIVLLVGYVSWPSSWRSHLPRQFAATLRDICRFMEAALIPDPAAGSRGWQPRRTAYRALGDLHGEYQRATSEPAAVSRRASAWWPAIIALGEVADATTATSVAIRQGAPAPSPDAVHQLTAALYAVAGAIDADVPPRIGELPGDEALKPVTDTVRPVLSALGSGPQPARPARPRR